jgi:hypothetical protein
VSLRIAFDLDGVLADMESALLREAAALFGPAATEAAPPSERPPIEPQDKSTSADADLPEDDLVPAPPVRRLRLTPRQARRLWRHVEMLENFWESLDELEPGAVAHLATLARERRWEVIFLTKRPESGGDTVQLQTQRWLQAKGFMLPSVFVVQGSRGLVADALALDVVIDDRPENCMDVAADSNAGAFLLWRGLDKDVPAAVKHPPIRIVKSVEDCLAILCEVDSSSRMGPGFVERVLHRLGLKQPVSTRDYLRSRKLPSETSSKS